MTKDELITKQQIEIEEYKEMFAENEVIRARILGHFFNIGAPLNDNVLQFNKKQLEWCFNVSELFEDLNTKHN